MANYGMAEIKKLAEDGLRIKERWDTYKRKGEALARRGLGTAETIIGGGAAGFIAGRFPGKTVMHMPIGVVAGSVLVAGAFVTDFFGDQGEHLQNIGDGMLAFESGRYTAGIGAKMAGALPQTTAGTAFGASVGAPRMRFDDSFLHQAAAAGAHRTVVDTVGVPVG